MTAIDDPRVASLYGFAKAYVQTEPAADWTQVCMVLVHPSARGMHRHVIAQGGDRMPDGTAMMVGDAARLRLGGIPVDGTPYAVISAGDINVVLPVELDDEDLVRIGRSVLGGVRP